MSKTPHTPEPWTAKASNTDGYWWFIESPSGLVADLSDSTFEPRTDRANARRAAACVNACAGMKDPDKEITAMRQALEDIVAIPALIDDLVGDDQQARTRLWMAALHAAIRKARTALPRQPTRPPSTT